MADDFTPQQLARRAAAEPFIKPLVRPDGTVTHTGVLDWEGLKRAVAAVDEANRQGAMKTEGS